MGKDAMSDTAQNELAVAIKSDVPLAEIVSLLRRQKEQGITQDEVYSFLVAWHNAGPDEKIDDRILEVADFVAGSCAPHMKIWNNQIA